MNPHEIPCAEAEERLSAFLDGELAPGAAVPALEHAFGCPACRAFFAAARRLQELAPALGGEPVAEPSAAEPAADRLWERIRAESGLDRAPQRPRLAPAAWLRAAALVALGLGGGYLYATLAGPAATPSPAAGGASAVVVAADAQPGVAMDERRFVALAEELLAADRKYQRTMLQVLRLVPALETGEGLDRPEERGFVRARVEEERPARGAV